MAVRSPRRARLMREVRVSSVSLARLLDHAAGGEAGTPRAWWLDGVGTAGPRALAVRPFRPSTDLAPCPDPVTAARAEAREDAR